VVADADPADLAAFLRTNTFTIVHDGDIWELRASSPETLSPHSQGMIF
jgi:hypothetical protein